jgi:O-antigen ligase
MIFLGYMVSRHFNNKSGYFTACVMSSAMIIECTLVLLQMITKASIGGIWYFLGERTFSIGNIGISTVSALGQEWLRAYGSFPHPNVLAFFLLFGLVFVVHGLRNTNRKTKGFFYLSFVLGSLCLLLTYSRLVILLYLIFCIVNAIQYTQLRKTFVSITIILSVFILFFFQRFGYEMIFSSDLYYRIDLAKIALKIISEYPLFGVGLNNYFYYQIDYQRMVTPVLLQPPHSIYLISLLNFGIIGGIFFLYLLYKTIIRAYWHLKHMRNSMQYTGSLLFIALLIVGFADHYFVTLQQGLLLMTYILGIIWIPKAKEWV